MSIPETEIQLYDDQIIGFSCERVDMRVYIDLYTTFGEGKYLCTHIKLRYLLVNANTSYNILLGWSPINRLGAIISTPHLAMKFPFSSDDIVIVQVDQKVARERYVARLKVEPTSRPYYKESPRGQSCNRRREQS